MNKIGVYLHVKITNRKGKYLRIEDDPYTTIIGKNFPTNIVRNDFSKCFQNITKLEKANLII